MELHAFRRRSVAALTLVTALSVTACGSPPTPPGFKVLAPATVPSVAKECSHPLTRTADGNVTPLTCPGGRLNVLAWHFYARLGKGLLSLGRHPSVREADTTFCSDMSVNHATGPEEVRVATLASQYYGWSFAYQIETFAYWSCRLYLNM